MKISISLFVGLFSFVSTFAQLTFLIDSLAPSTPANESLYIAGDFQGWNPGNASYRLSQDSITSYHYITLNNLSGNIQFKFTRGDWNKVESNAEGNALPNRTYTVVQGDTLRISILGWEDLDGSPTTNGGPSTAEPNVSILSQSFFMPQLNRSRRIWLYLPPGYHNSTETYPVLYMHDGQNVFDAATSFVGEWEVDETLNALHAQGDPGIIVVAIDNGQALRSREYAPWPFAQNTPWDGPEYIDFIVQTLKPLIDSAYRTKPEREFTGIMGSSLGGLISTYAAIRYQDVFGILGSFSPAYWFTPEIFEYVTDNPRQHGMRIYQNAGTSEGSRYIDNMFAMEDSFVKAGFSAGNIKTIEHADGAHSEWYWAREFEDAYLWLFRTTSTKVENPILLDDFRVFPNPTTGRLSIGVELRKRRTIKLEILDLSGKVVWQEKFRNQLPGKTKLEVNMDANTHSKGIYFCRIWVGKESRMAKFILK